jgi:hypothetical protein
MAIDDFSLYWRFTLKGQNFCFHCKKHLTQMTEENLETVVDDEALNQIIAIYKKQYILK